MAQHAGLRLCGHGAVEGKGSAGEGCGPERRKIPALARVGEPAAVARGHFHIGQEMVTQGHGLRDLQVGEAGHHCCRVLERLLGERALIAGERLIHRIDRRPDP